MIPIKHPLESVIVEFDFSSELPALTGASVFVSILHGQSDPSVGTMIEGAAQISGAKVFQRIAAGVIGLDYHLQCLGQNGLDKIIREDIMRVRSAA